MECEFLWLFIDFLVDAYVSDNSFKLLNDSVFIYFDNSDNKFVLKNLFYIQYILFEKDGLNLRNAYAHGDSLVYENHYVDLMYVLSALIAACLIIENI